MLAVAMSAVSLYYYLQVLKRVFVMPAVEETPLHANPVTMGVLAMIALLVVILGCLPGLLQTWMATFTPVCKASMMTTIVNIF